MNERKTKYRSTVWGPKSHFGRDLKQLHERCSMAAATAAYRKLHPTRPRCHKKTGSFVREVRR